MPGNTRDPTSPHPQEWSMNKTFFWLALVAVAVLVLLLFYSLRDADPPSPQQQPSPHALEQSQ